MSLPAKRHPIRVAARRTGTSETTLRAWERRYRAVSPARAETGRRLYSDQDIERLQLIRRAVDAGRSVSSVANLPDAALRRLVDEDIAALAYRHATVPHVSTATSIIEACLEAVERMDAVALRSLLRRAAMNFPSVVLIDQIVAPLLHGIGERWHADRLSPRHEHMATSIIRAVLSQLHANVEYANPYTVVVGTPPGQIHDIGTLFIAAAGVSEGWNVVNLGADIPAADIASAAKEVSAEIVALSLVYPPDDPSVVETFAYLADHLDESIRLVVGGGGASSYRDTIESIGAVVFESSADFVQLLSKHSV
jgi:methanogenic corrinoid protein MtbC1